MVWFLPVVPAVDPGPGGSGGSLLGILLVVNLIFNGVPCVLTALALWRTARWRGVVRPWLALIPVADLWVLGTLADRYYARVKGKDMRMCKRLPLLGAGALGSVLLTAGLSELLTLLDVGTGLIMSVEMLMLFCAIAVWAVFLVMRTIALLRFYEGFAPRHPELYMVLSIVFPILIPLFVFKCRY